MHAESIRPDQLTNEAIARWRAFAATIPGGDSPFLDPAFTQRLAEHRRSVEVGVVDDGGEVVGFFPFERVRGGVGAPPGHRLCDVQAILAADGHPWSWDDFMRGCHLRSLQLDRLLTAGLPTIDARFSNLELRALDLSNGYEAYLTTGRQRRSHRLADIARRRRRFERDCGPLRFEWHEPSDAALAELFSWKSAQRRETRSFDVLQFDWVRDFLTEIRDTQTEPFAGVMSTLYVGDQLAAVHLGLRTRTSLAVWFQAYNRDFGTHSPGAILLLEIASAAADRGIRRMELGVGTEPWKASFASVSLPACCGMLDRKPWRQCAWNTWNWLRDRGRPWLSSSTVRLPKRMLRSLHDWSVMR